MDKRDKRYTILFVDDEERILDALRRGLYEEDYQCLFAASGQKALELMDTEEVAVIVSDMRMPGMDGLHLLRLVRERHPRTVRIVLSGYTQLQQILTTINSAGIFKFITKPWMLDEDLKLILNEALAYYQLQERKEELEMALRKQNAAYQNILHKLDTLVENASRQTARIGELARDALFALAKRMPEAPLLPQELIVTGDLLRRFADHAVVEAVDRTSTDISMLFRTALLRNPGIQGIDLVPFPEDHMLRTNTSLLQSLAEALPKHLGNPSAGTRVRLVLRTEEVDALRMLSVSLLFLPPKTPSQDVSTPATAVEGTEAGSGEGVVDGTLDGTVEHAKETAAVLDTMNLVLDPIMRTLQSRFHGRMTSVGTLCRFFLPLRNQPESPPVP